MSGAIPILPPPPYAFMANTGTTSLFFCFYPVSDTLLEI